MVCAKVTCGGVATWTRLGKAPHIWEFGSGSQSPIFPVPDLEQKSELEAGKARVQPKGEQVLHCQLV